MQKKWKTPLFDLKSEFPSKIIDLLAEDVAVSHGIELLRFVHRRLQSSLIVVSFLQEMSEKYRQVDIAFKAGLTRKSFFQPPPTPKLSYHFGSHSEEEGLEVDFGEQVVVFSGIVRLHGAHVGSGGSHQHLPTFLEQRRPAVI